MSYYVIFGVSVQWFVYSVMFLVSAVPSANGARIVVIRDALLNVHDFKSRRFHMRHSTCSTKEDHNMMYTAINKITNAPCRKFGPGCGLVRPATCGIYISVMRHSLSTTLNAHELLKLGCSHLKILQVEKL